MNEKIYTIKEIENMVRPVAEEYDIDALYLFGSYAKGMATAESDLDFRIDRGRVKGLRFANLYNRLEDVFKKPVDLVTSASLDERFRKAISNEEVLLYAK